MIRRADRVTSHALWQNAGLCSCILICGEAPWETHDANDCEQTLNALERHASAEPIDAASAQGYSSPVLSFYP
jgi:hypothetical protein